MSSGFRSIGEDRQRASVSLVQPAKLGRAAKMGGAAGDGFAEVFRLIANASPPAAPPRGPAERAAAARGDEDKRDAERDAERDVRRAAAQEARKPRSTMAGDVPPEAALREESGDLPPSERASAAPFEHPAPREATHPTSPTPERTAENELGQAGEAEPLDEVTSEGATDLPARQPAEPMEPNPPVVAASSVPPETLATPEVPKAATGPKIEAPPAPSSPETAVTESEGASLEAKGPIAPVASGRNESSRGEPSPRPPQPVPVRPAAEQPTMPQPQGDAIETGPPDVPAEATEEAGKPIFSGGEEERGDARRRFSDPRDRQVANQPLDPHRPRDAMRVGEGSGAAVSSTSPSGGLESLPSSLLTEGGQALEKATLPPANLSSASSVAGSAAAASAVTTSGSEMDPRNRSAPLPANVSANSASANAASGESGAVERRPTANAPTAAGNAQDGPGIADRIRLVQRVAKAFQRLGGEGGQVRIRLHPAELGGVQLEMQIEGNRMNARLVTETEAARGVLRDQLADLRQRLSEQGMQVERIEVQVESDASGQREGSSREMAGERFGSAPRRETPQRDPRQPTVGTWQGDAERPRAERSLADAIARPGVDLRF